MKPAGPGLDTGDGAREVTEERDGERGGTEASQVKCVVRKVWDDWGTFEGTGGIFTTGMDHRGVLTRGFHRLCYSLLAVSAATGAEVEKSTSLFKTTHHFGTTGLNLTFFVSLF